MILVLTKLKIFFSLLEKFKKIAVLRKRKIKIANPAMTETKRAATKGSAINFKVKALIHINKGCFPSV